MFRSVLPGLLLVALQFIASEARAQSWLEALVEVDELTAAGALEEAEARGTEAVELAEVQFGSTSDQLADTYIKLGEVQLANERSFAAEVSVTRALEIYERNHGVHSERLVDPYIALGDVFTIRRQHDYAFDAYQQARDIVRRGDGLRDVSQNPITLRMSDAAMALDESELAVGLQLEVFDLVEREFGAESEEFYLAHVMLADWFSANEFYREASEVYDFASALVLLHPDGDPLNAVYLLQRAATSFAYGESSRRLVEFDDRRQFLSSRLFEDDTEGATGDDSSVSYSRTQAIRKYGEFYAETPPLRLGRYRPIEAPEELNRALNILHAQPLYPIEIEAVILRDMGDWDVFHDLSKEYDSRYTDAWELLTEHEVGAELIDEWFTSVEPLTNKKLRSSVLSDEEGALDGYVELEFLIDVNGVATDIEVIAAEPEGLVDREAIRFIRSSRFRPGLVDGELVESVRTKRIEFRYDPRHASD